MTDICKLIEANIKNKSYQKRIFNEEVISYYWSDISIIFDIFVNENKCAINIDNQIIWFLFDLENYFKVADEISNTINILV